MLQKEFEERVGKQVTPAEYKKIEELYMACDTDKDTFCELWKANKANKMVKLLAAEVNNLNIDIKGYEQAANKLEGELAQANQKHATFVSDMADWLLEQAEANDDDTLRQKVIELVGQREYLTRKARQSAYEFTDDDRELLVSLLTTQQVKG